MNLTRKQAAEQAARYAMQELAVIKAREERFGTEEDWQTGTVFRFKRQYEVPGKFYDFAALKVVGGLWYLTKSIHSRVASPLNWDDLMDFLEDVEDVEVATEWQPVDPSAPMNGGAEA
jgi:hypothetical protein